MPVSGPQFDKVTVQSIIHSGMSVMCGQHVHATARFWLAEQIKAGRVTLVHYADGTGRYWDTETLSLFS